MLVGESAEGRVVNPARAGMIRDATTETVEDSSKPRASGDDPLFNYPGLSVVA